MLLCQKCCNNGGDSTNGENTSGVIDTSAGPDIGVAHGGEPEDDGSSRRARNKRVGGADDGSDRRDGGSAARADAGATLADNNHRSSAAKSSGITEDDYNISSGRDRHSIPSVRSTSDFGESRDNGATSAAIVERLEKMLRLWFHDVSRCTDKAERCWDTSVNKYEGSKIAEIAPCPPVVS